MYPRRVVLRIALGCWYPASRALPSTGLAHAFIVAVSRFMYHRCVTIRQSARAPLVQALQEQLKALGCDKQDFMWAVQVSEVQLQYCWLTEVGLEWPVCLMGCRPGTFRGGVCVAHVVADTHGYCWGTCERSLFPTLISAWSLCADKHVRFETLLCRVYRFGTHYTVKSCCVRASPTGGRGN